MISEELKNDLKIKWDRMRDGMAKMGMDACLLTVDVNLYYTTGQIYSGYFYLPVDGEPWFLIKRPNGLSGHQVEYIRKPLDVLKARSDIKWNTSVSRKTSHPYLRNKGLRCPKSSC